MSKFINGLWWPDSEEHLVSYGLSYQEKVRDLAMSKLLNKRVCLDVGAHVGIATVHFAKHFNQVFSFEPVKETFECLIKNTSSLPNVTIFNKAVSNKEEQIYIEINPTNTGNSVPAKIGNEVLWSTPIKAITLDSLPFADVDLIKIDVEGFEAFVLQGAETLIRRNKPIIILEVKGLGATKDNPGKPLEVLESFGYVITGNVGRDYIVEAATRPIT